MYEICALKVERAAVAAAAISMGGGVKNNRNAVGKARTRSVLVLNTTRTSPATKTGREIMWYSSGLNVYDPCQYRKKAKTQRMVPAISCR